MSQTTTQTVAPARGKDIHWTQHTTRNGKKFEVGVPKGSTADGGKEPMVKHDFGVRVDWPVSSSAWTNTDPNLAATSAITRFAVYRTTGLYNYEIDFTNTEHYDYVFFDETGDSYSCNTWRNGDHYVRYNSDQPNIIFMKGS